MSDAGRRVQLSAIDPATDCTQNRSGSSGALILSRADAQFSLSWAPRAVANSPQSRPREEGWQPNTEFMIDCSQLLQLQLHENPLSLSLIRSDKATRIFSFSDSEFISLTEFIEELLVNGIAVPTATDSYSLLFYRRCHKGVFPYIPPHLQLTVEMNHDLNDFWRAVEKFFESLVLHMNLSRTLPRDQNFPFVFAAEALHARVLEKVDAFARQIPKYERIEFSEWGSLFDADGRISDPALFKSRLFHAGIDSALLSHVLPFAFGVYPLSSTAAEREVLKRELDGEFSLLLNQAISYDPTQIENSKKLASAFRVIQHDVGRTDRQLAAFRAEGGAGLEMVTHLLRAYCLFNPPIGYLQGMNDLFVPILLAFLPDWNDDGEPVDETGNPIDHRPYLSTIFWCFEAMLRHINHLDLLACVTEQCKKLANKIHDILMTVSPVAAIWMRRVGINGLLWMYSDFVLLFKRSFQEIWPTWLQLNAAPYPEHWVMYFVSAIIVRAFTALKELETINITVLMEAFPRILATIDFDTIGVTALWLAQTVPPPPEQCPSVDPQIECTRFKFFETGWTGFSESSSNLVSEIGDLTQNPASQLNTVDI
jgi:hypothetical protein